MVGVGSSANFTCQSNIQNGIAWYFTPLGGQPHSVNDTSLPTGMSVSFSGDGRSSTVHLRHVEKQFAGTFKCVDNDAAAYAHLTVVGK